MAPNNMLSNVPALLNSVGITWQLLLASSWKRYFDALVASSVFSVSCDITSNPAGQDYYPAYIFFLLYALFILVLAIFHRDWQKRCREYQTSEEPRTFAERRRQDFQRWRELPRWDDRRRLSPWYAIWKRNREEEARIRRRVTMSWVRQHTVTFSHRQMRSRLRERARVYVRHAYQAPSWALRATRSMEEIRRSPPPEWVAIPRRTDHDASASHPGQPSRPSVRQTASDASSQASTSRPTTTAKPPPKKKQSLYDMLRAENFTDPLLGYRHAQRKPN